MDIMGEFAVSFHGLYNLRCGTVKSSARKCLDKMKESMLNMWAKNNSFTATVVKNIF